MSQPEPYSLRLCRKEDIDQILTIEKATFPDAYDRSTFTQILMAEPGGFIVAERAGRIIGYVCAISAEDEAIICSIAVSQNDRRGGIGRSLMKAELGHLSEEVDSVLLQVSVKNEAAISLYHEFGFHTTGRIRRYYPNGDDAWTMALKVSRPMHQ